VRLVQLATAVVMVLFPGVAVDPWGARGAPGGWQEDPGQVKEFSILARRFEFVPDRIEVDEGDRVRMVLETGDGTHGLEIKAFGVREKVTRRGGPVTMEFDATEAGTFKIACSEYCGKGHSEMKGVLVVRSNGDRK
jgi:heme/copper-type cytochrome/quinol oxidase subunit 2